MAVLYTSYLQRRLHCIYKLAVLYVEKGVYTRTHIQYSGPFLQATCTASLRWTQTLFDRCNLLNISQALGSLMMQTKPSTSMNLISYAVCQFLLISSDTSSSHAHALTNTFSYGPCPVCYNLKTSRPLFPNGLIILCCIILFFNPPIDDLQ